MGEINIPELSVNGRLDGCDRKQNGNRMDHHDTSNAMNGEVKCSAIDPASDAGSCPPPIAIIGMGLRLPGGVNTATSFWDLIINKASGRCRVPADRYNIDAFYDPTARPKTVKAAYGYFIENYDLQRFDASFFSMSKSEVEKVDPQQRMLLEVVRECLESAGKTSWKGDRIGCYVGSFGEDWLDLGAKDTQSTGLYRISGAGDFVLANRVSYEFDFKGPRYDLRQEIRTC